MGVSGRLRRPNRVQQVAAGAFSAVPPKSGRSTRGLGYGLDSRGLAVARAARGWAGRRGRAAPSRTARASGGRETARARRRGGTRRSSPLALAIPPVPGDRLHESHRAVRQRYLRREERSRAQGCAARALRMRTSGSWKAITVRQPRAGTLARSALDEQRPRGVLPEASLQSARNDLYGLSPSAGQFSARRSAPLAVAIPTDPGDRLQPGSSSHTASALPRGVAGAHATSTRSEVPWRPSSPARSGWAMARHSGSSSMARPST